MKDIWGYLTTKFLRRGTRYKDSRGSTLIELLVVTGLLLLVITTLFSLLANSMGSQEGMKNVATIQQNARGTLNFITRDLLFAGAEITVGGIPVPTQYRPEGILYPITPHYAQGPTINGQTTDKVTILYSHMVMQKVDNPAATPFQVNGISKSGDQITLDTTNGNPDTTNLKVGDILLIKGNSQGSSALGYVTAIPSLDKVNFSANDPLKLNQTGASSLIGKLSCLNQGGGPGCVDAAAAIKVNIIQYYLDNSGAVNPNDQPALMRRRNGDSPSPVGMNIELFQLTYLLVNEVSGRNPSNPLNIRRAIISLLARSNQKVRADGSYYRFQMDGNVTTKNLAYFNK